jgi:hypothetical protein
LLNAFEFVILLVIDPIAVHFFIIVDVRGVLLSALLFAVFVNIDFSIILLFFLFTLRRRNRRYWD